jgi:nuclear transport factor 2 (NTF2) superfamily protein
MVDRDTVARWLDGYLRAWDSNDPADIGALFSADADYRFEPWEEPVRGREAIVAAWRDRADAPGDHRFDSEVIALDGDLAVVQGHTEYDDGRVYENLWVIRFDDDGAARSFTEWYMAPPRD